MHVTFQFSNRLALIEIKWLEKSVRDDGNGARRFTADYSNSRAREGAKQLVDYLELNNIRAGSTPTMGYLVVIDARRWGMNLDTSAVSPQDGMHYADREIIFNPEYHKVRQDFAAPIRMFVTPNLA